MLINRILGYRFNKTTIVCWFCLACVFGVYASVYLNFSWVYLPFIFIFIQSLTYRNIATLIFYMLLGFTIGLSRASLINTQYSYLDKYIGQKVEVMAIAKEDGSYDSKKRIAFQAQAIEVNYPDKTNISVPIKINTFISSGISKGDKVVVSGKLYSGFSNWSATIGYADVEVIGKSSSFVDKFRNNFTAKLRNSLPEPAASFAAGLLIGQKTGLSEDLQEALRKAGLTHIIAVSGYNLTVIIRAIRRLFSKLSRFQIVMLSGFMILSFVGVTGMSPSILRALIVSFIMLGSWYYGRKPRPAVLMCASLAISALIEPNNVLNSIGWYLSFTAFFGVIVISPILINKIKRKTLWKTMLIESFCAGLMTLPVIAYSFSKVSLMGVLANSFVVPLVPVAMLGSLLAGITAWISPVLGSVVGYPTKYLLNFILDFSKAISILPGTNLNIKISIVGVLLFYISIVLSTMLIHKKRPLTDVLQ